MSHHELSSDDPVQQSSNMAVYGLLSAFGIALLMNIADLFRGSAR